MLDSNSLGWTQFFVGGFSFFLGGIRNSSSKKIAPKLFSFLFAGNASEKEIIAFHSLNLFLPTVDFRDSTFGLSRVYRVVALESRICTTG
jgi:hypothetical protein